MRGWNGNKKKETTYIYGVDEVHLAIIQWKKISNLVFQK